MVNTQMRVLFGGHQREKCVEILKTLLFSTLTSGGELKILHTVWIIMRINLLTIDNNTEMFVCSFPPAEDRQSIKASVFRFDVSDGQRSSLTVHPESVSKFHSTVKHINYLLNDFSYSSVLRSKRPKYQIIYQYINISV